ncbi:Big-1 (bacterial Ig-like domain 1) domain containing protein [uncultured Caudovirales phage]|uniref:Big-1 (Bacterial Ig-like domain 1) domain containing protein n=1 Tax=uncultured Caudovirales phage TaxID=2100421 RepID=A0A6J5Q563_9CAUD|nr:Big-1 (bacterial Ig-like domain 1) domain containing protein [uncultured Caudovirales phage]CAB4150982.1 Big-1 (bacterial Ig-like domain 1) domain containing protein [uncultured Caudovirales phage]CAB4174724.1 Big-1 (bacterial Ig-like domain 1) domain containing protein [uncultured Caudovirales phage]CAB4179872.1 Big-1 (bacterial Ig-like domain 1) domain containing protein [uncultured Caudovirales phage]CAB4185527.1 Big-1 (bacterial Ig-like domain 1) domain containing protein [uncultured Cau
MNSFKKIAIASAAALAMVCTSVSVANASTPQSTSISATGIARVAGAFYVNPVLTSSVLSGTGTDTVYTLMTGAPTGVTLPSAPESHTANAQWVNGSLVDTNTVNLVTQPSRNGGISSVLAGTYTFLIWADSGTVGSALYPQIGNAVTNITVIAGSNPSSMVFSSTSLTGATRTYIPTTISVKDQAGVPTLLNQYEMIVAQPSGGSVSTSATGSDSQTVGASLWIDNTKQAKDGSIKVYLQNNNAGTASTAFSGAGFLSVSTLSASVSINTFNTVNATGVAPSSAQGVLVNSATLSGSYTGSNTITASTTNVNTKSLKFNVTAGTANTGGIVLATVSQTTGVVLPTGVVAGTTQLTLDASGNGSFTVSTTNGGVASQGYTVNVGGVTFVVTYATPTPLSTNFGLSPNPQGSTGTTSITTAFGATTKVTATVLDQFGDPSQGSLITFNLTASGNRNGSNSVIALAVTDANGFASASFTDAVAITNTSAADDHITASLVFPGSAGTVSPNTAKAYVNIHYIKTLAVSKVNISYVSGATTDLNSVLDNAVTYSVSVIDPTGTALSGIPVSYAISGGYDASALQSGTVYTSAGSANIVVKGTKVGKIIVTATAGGVTASDSTITVTNATTDARTITLDAASYSVANGGLQRVKATVKDRYGNAVASQTVTFTTSVGRFAGNALSVTGLTDATGVAIADIAPLQADIPGAGTLIATFSNGDSSTATSLVASSGTYPVATTSAKAGVTVVVAISNTSDITTAQKATDAKIAELTASVSSLIQLVTSLVAKIDEVKSNANATQAVADAKYRALVAKYNALAKKFKQPLIK